MASSLDVSFRWLVAAVIVSATLSHAQDAQETQQNTTTTPRFTPVFSRTNYSSDEPGYIIEQGEIFVQVSTNQAEVDWKAVGRFSATVLEGAYRGNPKVTVSFIALMSSSQLRRLSAHGLISTSLGPSDWAIRVGISVNFTSSGDFKVARYKYVGGFHLQALLDHHLPEHIDVSVNTFKVKWCSIRVCLGKTGFSNDFDNLGPDEEGSGSVSPAVIGVSVALVVMSLCTMSLAALAWRSRKYPGNDARSLEGKGLLSAKEEDQDVPFRLDVDEAEHDPEHDQGGADLKAVQVNIDGNHSLARKAGEAVSPLASPVAPQIFGNADPLADLQVWADPMAEENEPGVWENGAFEQIGAPPICMDDVIDLDDIEGQQLQLHNQWEQGQLEQEQQHQQWEQQQQQWDPQGAPPPPLGWEQWEQQGQQRQQQQQQQPQGGGIPAGGEQLRQQQQQEPHRDPIPAGEQQWTQQEWEQWEQQQGQQQQQGQPPGDGIPAGEEQHRADYVDSPPLQMERSYVDQMLDDEASGSNNFAPPPRGPGDGGAMMGMMALAPVMEPSQSNDDDPEAFWNEEEDAFEI